MQPQDKAVIAAHFQTLKRVWDSWLNGGKEILPKETENFFTGLTSKYFQEAMHRVMQGQMGDFTSLVGEISPRESWQLMRAYFNKKRPRARHQILDSVFAEALACSGKRLSEALDSDLRHDVIFLLGKYKLYCFSAVRDFYVPERLEKPSVRWKVKSGNAPVDAEWGSDSPELFDGIADEERELAPVEEVEMTAIARDHSKSYFEILRNAQKAGLLAIYARNRAGIKLRYDDPRIAEFVDVSEAQFYELRRTALARHITQFRETLVWKGEDSKGRHFFEDLLVESLLEESYRWYSEKKPEHLASIFGDRLTSIARLHSEEYFETLDETQKEELFDFYVKQRAKTGLAFDNSEASPLAIEYSGPSGGKWKPVLEDNLREFQKSSYWLREDSSGRERLERLLVKTILEESFQWSSRKKRS